MLVEKREEGNFNHSCDNKVEQKLSLLSAGMLSILQSDCTLKYFNIQSCFCFSLPQYQSPHNSMDILNIVALDLFSVWIAHCSRSCTGAVTWASACPRWPWTAPSPSTSPRQSTSWNTGSAQRRPGQGNSITLYCTQSKLDSAAMSQQCLILHN